MTENHLIIFLFNTALEQYQFTLLQERDFSKNVLKACFVNNNDFSVL